MKATATSIPACVGGLDVKPIHPSDNIANVTPSYRHGFCDRLMTFPFVRSFSNFINLLFGKFVNWAFLAPIVSAVLDFILKISRPSVIAKIINMIVQWVTVIVAAIHPFWPWSYKSKQNKVVNIKAVAFSHNVKVHVLSVDLINSRLKYFSGHFLIWSAVFSQSYAINTANLSKVRNFIKSLVSGNRFPDFFHVVAPSNAPKCKIHGSQWSDWFSGANLAMKPNYTFFSGKA